MYQFNMSIDRRNAHWFYDIENVLSGKIKEHGGIMASEENAYRVNVSIACENENRQSVENIIRECITEIFLTRAKADYLTSALKLPLLDLDAYTILLHTLVVFDRETEREILSGALKLGDNLALDGFFNFGLSELKKRWEDIAALVAFNAACLKSDDTLNELLKFLMSAVSPKITKLEIIKKSDGYGIRGNCGGSEFEYGVVSSQQLMIYLINAAPIELTLYGSFENDKIFDRIVSIFDVKKSGFAEHEIVGADKHL